MKEVVARFAKIVEGLSWWKLRSRVVYVDKEESMAFSKSALIEARHWATQVNHIVKRIPAIPTA